MRNLLGYETICRVENEKLCESRLILLGARKKQLQENIKVSGTQLLESLVQKGILTGEEREPIQVN